MRRVLRVVSMVMFILLTILAGFGIHRCWELRQWLFVGLYAALGLGCLGMIAASVWPERKRMGGGT